MKRLQSFLTLLVLLLVSVSASWAETLEVGTGKPYTTIQAAVTAASGGDIIEVFSGTYNENVNIPGGKNGLIIREKAGQTAILDGNTPSVVANPRVAFRISSDNVTIDGFTIQNYNYSGATNVDYGQAQRGVGIEAINASSQHTFTNNTITNCNWGIYVREGNNINVQNNTIDDFVSTAFAGTWNQQGGVGIAFISAGIAMDGNIIKTNILNNAGTNGTYGIAYGRIGGNVGADFVQIKSNEVYNGMNTGFYAYGIFNIKTGESVDFSLNLSHTNNAALDLLSSISTDNDDVTITNNNFWSTISTVEVRANDLYSGEKLWEAMITNANDFSDGSDLSNAIASVYYTKDTITSDGANRFIFNNLDAAITEAEQFMNIGAFDDGRVYVTNGTYTSSATATVNGLPATKKLLIEGQSLAAIINSSAAIALDIQSPLVEVDPITFQSDLTSGNVVAINTSAASTLVHHVAFTSVNNGANYYVGVKVLDGADNVNINNNTFAGAIGYGIEIETNNTIMANIECNRFDNDVAYPNNRGIFVYDITAGNNIKNIEIISNTFTGLFEKSIEVNMPTVGSGNIFIGRNNKGNIFETTNTGTPTALFITQLANNQVAINYNKFDNDLDANDLNLVAFDKIINNFAAFDVNAGFNYWDIAMPYATNIPLEITGAGAAKVSWLPIYTDSTDQDLTTCGFQPLLTSLWTPVYTAENAGDAITVGTNEFFLTVEAALIDFNTTSGDNDFVYLYLNGTYPETNATVLDFNSINLTVAAAPAQPANLNTRPSPKVSSSFAGAMFDVNFDNITFDKIEFTSATVGASAYYPIHVTPAIFSGLTVTDCKFNVSGATSPDAAILFSGITSRANLDFQRNIFTIADGNYAIDFGTLAATTNGFVEINLDTVYCADNTTTAIRFGQINNLDMTNNVLEAGISFTAGTVNTTSVDILGNKFLPTASSVPTAIKFYHDNVVAGKYDGVNIQQNQIQQFGVGIDIEVVADIIAQVISFNNWTINENKFANLNDGITLNGMTGATLDATNNHWQTNYGPDAYANAPIWHDDAGTPIIANSYGKLYNDGAGTNVVPLQDASYINFTPWWNNIAGAPSTYTGTSFAPIENNEPTPEYFASLIFAIDATATTYDIYMQDVPDWNTPGQTVYYVESNTIKNASKDLAIWGQPFFPPTTKIATIGNDAADDMFVVENVPALGSFDLNFLEFTYDVPNSVDIQSAVNYKLNGIGNIDWCYFNGIKGTTSASYIIYAEDATSNVTITNSKFEGNDNSVSGVVNILGENGSTLTIDNVEIKGNNQLGVGNIEAGALITGNSNLTITNSWFYNLNSGVTNYPAVYVLSSGVAGNVELYQNVFENNSYGIAIGGADFNANADIYNNIIRNNTIGLLYVPGMAIAAALNVENNNWGSDNGPRSELQIGATQENTFNEATQGNAVVDFDLNSEIDFLPWRRASTDDLSTKIAGPKFAPIVRTNAANLAQGLYSSFNDAEADLLPNQKVYAYAGTYSEHIAIDVANVQFIGKLAPATYSVGWIIAPNSPMFVNAWASGTQGANGAAPTIISGGLAQPLIVDDINNFNNVSIKGFIFDTKAKVYAAGLVPYTGDPTEAIDFNLNTDDINISYNTFLADAGDKGIVWGNGQHDNWDVTYNKYEGTAPGYFAYVDASTANTEMLINNNDLNFGGIYINKGGAGSITNFDITYNEFANTTGAISLDGTAGGGFITNLNVSNNIFESTNTYAFLVDATADNAIVNGGSWTDEVEVTNNSILIPFTASNIVVGFANLTPLVTYSNEITATCNWWGSLTGPTYSLNPGGSNGLVSDGVFFAPWLSGATNSATFGFTPTDGCNVGERVWVNNDANPATKTIIFPSLQWAVQHPTVVNGTNMNIFVSDAYNNATNDAGTNFVQENIVVDWDPAVDNTLYAESKTELKINGNFAFAGTNAYNLLLGSALRVTGNLTLDNIGCQGQFILNALDLTVEGNITEASYGAVVTNGAGYLVKEKVETGGINRFPVAYTEILTATPAQFVVNTGGFTTAQNNILKVRVNNTDPVTYKGMGEQNHSIDNIWAIDFTNNNASADPNMAMNLRFLDNGLNDGNFTLNKTIAYAAYWDMAPVALQWTTRKSTSSWNGSDGVQVTNLNLDGGLTEWSLFYGSTSYALSTPPAQAKNIQWVGGDDRNLKFQWQRNGIGNQYYAIMGVKGSMTAAPADPFVPTAIGAGTSSPWVASATSRNFSDGYVDNVTTPSWTSGLFHNLAALPSDVKVLKVGAYTGALSENVTVTDLDQGTYYTFFVANFNYGNGSSTIADMVTGADGMANYELGPNTLNPRTRKTQPAVYMTLDVSSPFAGDASNQPNIVYGTTLPTPTDSTAMLVPANYWRVNNVATGNVPVNNQYNGDDLIGGNYAQFCTPTVFPANNVLLYFKGYGNNGGANWGIKYSENNSTYTFTTPLVNSNTSRTRSVETKYYLVSAYDGDGKVAKLYDNNQDLQLIFDAGTVLTQAVVGTMPTCVGNSVQFTSGPNSVPNAIFAGWEVSTDNISYFPVDFTVGTGNVVSTGNVTAPNIDFTSLAYADNGKWFSAKYTSTSVCDYPTLGFAYYTAPIQLQVYDNTLTGTQPNVSGDAAPYICSDAASVTFTSADNAPLTPPNTLTLKGWYINDGVISVLITANGTYNNVNYTVAGIGTNSGTITVSNANMSLLDGIIISAEWKNGDCAVNLTTPTTLNIVDKPVITALTAPAGVCIDQVINIASVSTAANAGATQTIQWQYSTDNLTYNNLVDGVTADVTISGATTTNVTITPHNLVWDGYYVRVIYTHSENGTNCITNSNAVQIDVLPSPVFNAIADQTVCENTVMNITATDAAPVSWSGNIVWYHTSVAPGNLMTNGGTYFGSTVTINGTSNATFQIDNATLAWDGITVIAFNDNGACTGQESFVINVDAAPTVGTATVTAGEVCEGGSVVYSTTYTPAATGTVVWYYNGNPVTSGTSVTSNAFNNATIVTAAGTSTLTLAQVTIAIDGDPVYAEVDNGTCSVVNSNTVSADIETIPVATATVGAQNIFSHRFDITWTGVANADNYDVEVSELADFSVLKTSTNVTAPAVTWTGMANCVLDPATTYYFRVRANNQCGNGPWNTSNLVTLDPTVTSIAYQAPDNGAFGNVLVGTNSTSQQVDITYYQLDAGLTLDIPAGYEIFVGGSWLTGSNVDLTSDLTLYLGTPGSKITTTFDVRFSPITCGLHTGDLVLETKETCPGVTEMPTPDYVSVSGTGVVAAPTVAATNGIVMENVAGTFSANWTNGNGTNRLVILSTSATLSASPANNTAYMAGDMIGGGTVVDVLANPTAASTITVPVDGNNYYVHVWEYNACGANTEIYDNDYYTFQPYYLAFGPIIDPQTSGVESELIDMYLTQRNGDPILNPFANFNVTINNSESDITFSTNPNPVTILNNNSSTTFKFTWTNNCGVEDGYLIASATNINGTQSNTFNLNVSTPTMQSRIVVWVGVPCAASTSFKWTNGNGAGRLVVARDGALPIAPADFQVYTTNSDWSTRGASNLIGDDSYAMGTATGTNNSLTITNLTLGQTYYFRVFEYNGCLPLLRKYLTTNATFNPRSRTINCKEGNNLFDIVVDRFNATSNSGKGLINFNTLYEANISGFELRRINVTDEEMNGILVGSYMNNSELVAAGNTMTGKSYKFNDNSALLEVGKTYLYQLTAIAFDGTRIDVAETELTINDDIHTGITEFSVSPVTVTNNEARFDLTVNKAQNVTITMFDVTGQKVASIANDTRVNNGTQQFTTNIQNVTNGTYMIVVEAADGISAVQKFQIVR